MTNITEANKRAADELSIQIAGLNLWANLRIKDVRKLTILCLEKQIEVLMESTYFKSETFDNLNQQLTYLKSLL